jgi:hypothetical protein
MLFRARIFAALLVLSCALAACGGGGDDAETPTPSPSASPEPETASPTPKPPETGYRFVYREYGAKEDVIWRIVPWDPAQREKLVAIPHREGYGVVASMSPDGRILAYLSLPEEAYDETTSQAEAYVFDLKKGSNRLIAGGFDYTFRPLWSQDGNFSSSGAWRSERLSRREHRLHEDRAGASGEVSRRLRPPQNQHPCRPIRPRRRRPCRRTRSRRF